MKIVHDWFEYSFWNMEDKRMGKGFWFRVFGYGLWFASGPYTFSERNGYKKVRNLPFGWRYGFLRRGKLG